MKRMIDPREASMYDSAYFTAVVAFGFPVLALKRDPNRVAVTLSVWAGVSTQPGNAMQLYVVEGGTKHVLAVVTANLPIVKLGIEHYGQSIQGDLYLAASTTDLTATLADTHLCHRGA